MPQADLYITADQNLAPAAALAAVEKAILEFDSGAGACKGRAHGVAQYHHSHVLLKISMLKKPHRDAAYATELGLRLAAVLAASGQVTSPINVHISFDLDHYTTLKAG